MIVFAVAALALMVVLQGMRLAVWIPAGRASRVDPLGALQSA